MIRNDNEGVIRVCKYVHTLLLLVFLITAIPYQSFAQIRGVITDESTGFPVPKASIVYRSGQHTTTADSLGRFIIPRINEGILSITSVGYKPHSYIVRSATPNEVKIEIQQETKDLDEIVVSGKKSKYRRKGNPAVELMHRVIAAKKDCDIHQLPYIQYKSYQKIMAGLNDLKSQDLTRGVFKNRPWLRDNLEVSPYNGKLIMPVMLEETVKQNYFRNSPKAENNVEIAHKVEGLNKLFETGDIFNVILKEYFTDIDIYKDNVQLFQNSFCSPIGRDAILFYHYYVTDTTYVGNDLCYQIDFTPSNQQDIGFRGQLYVLADSSFQVKKCDLAIPLKSDLNWVEGMKSIQEYTQLENGIRVKSVDDMFVELMVTNFTAKAIITRNTHYFDYSTKSLPDSVFHQRYDNKLSPRMATSDSVMQMFRRDSLSIAELALRTLPNHIKSLRGATVVLTGMRALFENFIETGTQNSPSKFDIGPIFSTFSNNFYDGFRLRAGGQTTTNLFPHLFLKGYYAHAMKSHQNYYDAQLTYSFHKPKYLPNEFPRRTITIETMRDVALPSDKFMESDKDNMFSSLKIDDMDKMFLYNRQSIGFQYETNACIRLFGGFKHEKLKPIGNISFTPLTGEGTLSSAQHTEATFGLRYAKGETYLNSKQERWTLNYNAFVIRLQHTKGFKGLLFGQYNYNFTEFELDKRFWMPMNFGCIEVNLKMGAEWNQVPYPLLIIPASNTSCVLQPHSFDLINNMEFLNDRYLSAEFSWDLNGKIFNQIPLLKKLKCREHIGISYLWGSLTDKNNPNLTKNSQSNILMEFPEGCYVMNPNRPYWEWSLGVHNILNLIHIEYIRRMSYLDLQTAKKDIIKFTLEFKF